MKADVAAAMRARDDALPLLLVDGKIVAQGSYPAREVLAELAGVALPKSIYTEAVQELVAIGAAIAANCEPCFRYHLTCSSLPAVRSGCKHRLPRHSRSRP